MRIEHSRKHGPFDPRYPPIRHEPEPAPRWRLGEERRDWQGFLVRFLPDSSRHDLDALAAYESYRETADGRPGNRAPAPALASASAARTATTPRYEEEEPATADTDRWEGDGGASAADPRRRRRGERAVRT